MYSGYSLDLDSISERDLSICNNETLCHVIAEREEWREEAARLLLEGGLCYETTNGYCCDLIWVCRYSKSYCTQALDMILNSPMLGDLVMLYSFCPQFHSKLKATLISILETNQGMSPTVTINEEILISIHEILRKLE